MKRMRGVEVFNMGFLDKGEKDLFDETQTADKKIRKKTGFPLPRIKKSTSLSYENLIFLAIGFVMCCIISFSLGVEKGRRDVNHVRRKATPAGQPASRPEKETATRLQKNYIIQLAAFRKLGSAEEERIKLKKDGYRADVKKSGDYYQVYIGGFNKKQGAQRLLRKLKEKYKDCYIIEY